jgi:hypothetical protein
MDEAEGYVPPLPGSERWKQAHAERVAHTDESDDDSIFNSIMADLFLFRRPDDFLCPGDWIQYTHVMHVHNHRYNQCYAMIVNTDPKREYMISLSNGDLLPSLTRVTIIAR